jgi:hypothetical protein
MGLVRTIFGWTPAMFNANANADPKDFHDARVMNYMFDEVIAEHGPVSYAIVIMGKRHESQNDVLYLLHKLGMR